MRHRLLLPLVILGASLIGCGSTTNPAPSGPAQTSSGTTATIPASGGTISTTLGAQTLAVTAPAGAFAAPATVKITLETPASLTTTFAQMRAASKRTAESVPTGAVPLAAFIVDAGGVALLTPLQVAFSGLPAPATGQSVMISGYANSAFDDVAMMTYSSGTYSIATNPHYPGITLALPTIYVIYSVPTANIATPTAVVTVAGPASVGAGAQATYTATEATANGFPFLQHTFTFGVAAALGTINATTGVLSSGGTGGLGNVTATDAAVTTFTGTESIAISSARPGTTGLSEQYTGTLTEIDANNAIAGASATPLPGLTPGPAPTPVSTTVTAAATVAVTSTADAADTTASTTGVTFTANETDVANLSTLTSTTTSTVLYAPATNGTFDVLLKGSSTTDSTGVTYQHEYAPTTLEPAATPKITTILPETNGTFSNDASETYYETDPGIGVTSTGQQVTTTTGINANGTYSSTFLDPNAVTGTPVADTATENADFSGVLDYNSIDSAFVVQFGAPSGGSIILALIDPNFSLDNAITVPSYIPASATKPSIETDTITTGVALAGTACTNAATYPTAASIAQTKSVVDAIFGTVETRTTTSYDVVGIGTVCTVLSDTVNSYYDYSNQEGGALIGYDTSSTPILTTTVSETLSLQTTNAAQLQSSKRGTQSTGSFTMPVAVLASHVQHIAYQRAMSRLRAFTRLESSKLRGGLVK